MRWGRPFPDTAPLSWLGTSPPWCGSDVNQCVKKEETRSRTLLTYHFLPLDVESTRTKLRSGSATSLGGLGGDLRCIGEFGIEVLSA